MSPSAFSRTRSRLPPLRSLLAISLLLAVFTVVYNVSAQQRLIFATTLDLQTAAASASTTSDMEAEQEEEDDSPAPFVSLQDAVKNLTHVPIVNCEKCLINRKDKALLYALGKAASGPVLEEGAFCGCSTVSIALGMRDGAAQRAAEPYRLVTSDAFPVSPTLTSTPNQYRLVEEAGKESLELRVWDKLVLSIADDPVQVASFKSDMLPILERDGSILPCLFRTLHNHELHNDVTVVAGSSKTAPDLDYSMVFSDAAHDMQETKANEPSWSKYLKRGYPVIIVFDDVGRLPDVQEYLRNKYNPSQVFETHKVWAMQVPGN